MNPNINRHRSPTQRNPSQIPKGFVYPSYTPSTPRVDKNGMHSSTQESTKQEISSRQQQNHVRESQFVSNPINSGFSKVKKQEMNYNKFQVGHHHGLRSYNSQKMFGIKAETKIELKPNASPQKHFDYFGFKSGLQKYQKDRIKNDQKLSDSADSDFSHNSANNNKGQGKGLKFLSKKLQKKIGEDPMFKPQKVISRYTNMPYSKQQINYQHERRTGNYQINFQLQTPRNQSPSNSPSKKQDLTAPSTDNIIHKRSSLSPQNKLQLNRQISHQTIGVTKNNFFPKKGVTPIKVHHQDVTVQKNENEDKSFKNKNYNIHKQRKQVSNQDFSFCRQNIHFSPLQNQIKSRGLQNLPSITVVPLSMYGSLPVKFIIIEKLAENRSSSIYKCLHQSTNMIYCLKRCSVQSNNIQQLIVEHKVGTTLAHPNIVKAFATFYDRSSLYLLMQYMQDRSLSAILKQRLKTGCCDTTIKHSKSIQNFKISNRDSFWQRPRLNYQQTSNKKTQQHIPTCYHNFPFDPHMDRLFQIKFILEQLLQGLLFLHENGIMHRDLKPDNIFVSNNNFKIGDFGSCTYNNSQQYFGTLDYAAPEIMQKHKYDKSIDLWSMGCLAYHLDVGSPPFYHENRNQTIRRIVNVQYNANLITNFNLKKLIGKLLVKNGRITASQALMEVKMMDFGSIYNNRQKIWGK